MNESIWDYGVSLWNDIPRYILYIVLIVVIIGSSIFVKLRGLKKGLKNSVGLMLTSYVFIVFSATVLFRSHALIAGFKLMPFWSYIAYIKGEDDSLLLENIMNVIVFIPIGLMFACVLAKNSFWKVALLACILSVSIEVMQLITKNGLCEIDDVIHNTLGCVIGYGLFRMISWRVNKNYDI